MAVFGILMKVDENISEVFKIMADELTDELTKAVEECGALIEESLHNFPFKYEGKGNVKFRDSISTHISQSGGNVMLEVSSSAPQAKWIEQGAAPHVITPSSRKALMWIGGGGGFSTMVDGEIGEGGKIFSRLVHHPGVPDPSRPLETTLTNLRPAIEEILFAVPEKLELAAEQLTNGRLIFRNSATGQFASNPNVQ